MRFTGDELRKSTQARAPSAAIVHRLAATAFNVSPRAMNVARNRAGNVTMSPIAVTIGVETASRSQPRRNDCTASTTVTTSTMIEESTPPATEIVITDTIPVGNKVAEDPRFKVVSVSHLLGEAIRRIHNNQSVSSLFQ